MPGEFHGQRSLEGYSPWDDKELDMTNIFTDTIWMHLKNIILSERHQTQRPHVQFHLHEMSRISKSTGTESRLVVARDKEDEGMGRSCLMGIQGFILG